MECAQLLKDFKAVETILVEFKFTSSTFASLEEELHQMASLERTAHATLILTQQLQASSNQVTLTLNNNNNNNNNNNTNANASTTSNASSNANNATKTLSMDTPLPQDTERAQFIMKLAPRIRVLEKNVNHAIAQHLERVLKKRMAHHGHQGPSPNQHHDPTSRTTPTPAAATDLLILGHLFRSFALLNRGTDAQAIFANVAIMPIVRTKVSIGKLDEGGSRGECAGLKGLLEEIVVGVQGVWGDVLRMVEGMFLYDDSGGDYGSGDGGDGSGSEDSGKDGEDGAGTRHVEIDLITAGVWVPIVTALMADPAIKMAIFSPGIASIFQQNYIVMDAFLADLAMTLLSLGNPLLGLEGGDLDDVGNVNGDGNGNDTVTTVSGASAIIDMDEDYSALAQLYYQPDIDERHIQAVQTRIYCHPMTLDYSKKWNLPIYYQLRFGEICARLEKAIKGVQSDGWDADVYTGPEALKQTLKDKYAFELPFFMELFDSLTWMWRKDVFLKPLTHRFLRGTVQLLGRVIAFVKSGLEGEIKFGIMDDLEEEEGDNGDSNDDSNGNGNGNDNDSEYRMMQAQGMGGSATRSRAMDTSYKWCDRIEDVAAVSWELTVLADYIVTDHIPTVVEVVCPSGVPVADADLGSSFETSELIGEVMTESSKEIPPVVNEIWNEIIVNIMTKKCTAPLSAVKGVAATYRMTNRPPPTQPSPFVNTVLRPLKEFNDSFSNRIPSHMGILWKKRIVDTVSERYSTAVSELMETVQRTEEALKNRKARRSMAGGMSDGEKVRLQLYLDQRAFTQSVVETGIAPDAVEGVQNLISLTEGAQELLYEKTQS